jgi:hypothetical protein
MRLFESVRVVMDMSSANVTTVSQAQSQDFTSRTGCGVKKLSENTEHSPSSLTRGYTHVCDDVCVKVDEIANLGISRNL